MHEPNLVLLGCAPFFFWVVSIIAAGVYAVRKHLGVNFMAGAVGLIWLITFVVMVAVGSLPNRFESYAFGVVFAAASSGTYIFWMRLIRYLPRETQRKLGLPDLTRLDARIRDDTPPKKDA